MKIKLLYLFLFIEFYSFGQYSEFKIYDNGLIYSENAVTKLKHIVDSLNLKFKVCDLSKNYFALSQTTGNHIYLKGKKAVGAKKDFEANISYNEFKKKYPQAELDENLLIVKSDYIDYDEKRKIVLNNPEFSKSDRYEVYFDYEEIDLANAEGKWFFTYSEKTNYSSEGIEAFYIVENFENKVVPKKYARLIQYSDCLVDTTATVFNKNAKGERFYFDTIPNKSTKFHDYVETILKRPNFESENYDVLFGMDTIDFQNPKKKLKKKDRLKRAETQKIVEAQFEIFREKMDKWESSRLVRIDSLKNNDPNFLPMLNDALAEAKQTNKSDDFLEEYVALFVSKSEALELKRSRRVVGGCSMDNGPRVHAQNIALLSAEATKWEIFLRSHLDIMNDRFDRVSDGSYAWDQRQTYIKELEELDINVKDLLLGVSLRLKNPSENHYYGSINRIGRALAESKEADAVETSLLEMIADSDLDDFNRVLMYYLFDNYTYNLKDEIRKKENIERLKQAVAKMPDYIESKIDFANK